MTALFGNAGANAGEVNDFHINSDVDKSTLSQHHTLGVLPNQAAPGDHNHDGRSSKRIALKNLEGDSIPYEVQGGTIGGTQPTFSGAPLFAAHFTRWGNLCHFNIFVDFDNITSFGTGQYFLTLPFPARREIKFGDGCLHQPSTGREYQMRAGVLDNSDQLLLSTTDVVGQRVFDTPFTSTVPFTLTTADYFHIAGTYEIAP
jgi:hypothetical protein